MATPSAAATPPGLTRAFVNLARTVLRPGQVDRKLKALVALMASTAAGCRYCQAHTATIGTALEEKRPPASAERPSPRADGTPANTAPQPDPPGASTPHRILVGSAQLGLGSQAAIATDPEIVNLPWQGLTSLCHQLLAAGADPTARADSRITPLESAAMHGSTSAADVLIGHGLHRPSLWLAAATGRLDIVRTWVDPQGTLIQHPGPHRPNWADVGRPPGAEPTDDPDEVIGEALVFAAANGRAEVVDYLLDAGASVDARPYRNTTGLHLAIQFHQPDMVRQLIARGAATDIPDDEYGSDAGGWAAACDDGSAQAAVIVALMASRQESNGDS